MHRAEKASSKLCREREVEKAQELHRRKIDGVKSYLSATTKPSAPPEPKHHQQNTFFRRRQRHKPAQQQQQQHVHEDDGSEDVCSHGSDLNSFVAEDDECESIDMSSFGKLDELRSVFVPVMAHKASTSFLSSELDYERLLDEQLRGSESSDAIASLPPSLQHHESTHSLRVRAFRMRKLKHIEAANATLLNRIKHSTAHYRTDLFKKDWDQNVAYLASICEFPVLSETLHPSPPLARRKWSPELLPTLSHTATSPSNATIPTASHPIKAALASPRKPKQLNLAPAFRSLRNGLPQAPTLPPLTALASSPRKAMPPSKPNMTAIADSHSSLYVETAHDDQASTAIPPLSSPTRQLESPADDPLRYTLLTRGLFVGGKYLIFTVFSGDGIANPYGFDVVAKDPTTQLEFHLRVTKLTTHRLIDTISSSSMAEKTAAAAGTNLSMDLLAQCICDHVRYADLGRCELVYLIATVGTRGGLSSDDGQPLPPSTSGSGGSHLLLDIPHEAMALCLHQRVVLDGRWLHVFASTRPPQSCQASMTAMTSDERLTGEGAVLVWFEVQEDGGSTKAQCHVSVQALVEVLASTDSAVAVMDATLRLSLDRLMMIALSYLHYEPSTHDAPASITLVPSKVNGGVCETIAAPSSTSSSPRRPATMTLPPSPHRSPTSPTTSPDLRCVFQSGMLWRGAYLFVRVALLRVRVTGDDHANQDELLIINVFNTSTGSYSERAVDGAAVDDFSTKLGAWQAEDDTASDAPFVLCFARRLLLRMALQVDLHDHEIIAFPTLEPKGSRTISRGGRPSPEVIAKLRGLTKPIQDASPESVADERRAGEEDEEIKTTTDLVHKCSVFFESLPAAQQDFVQNRAAKCIQQAYRGYVDRSSRRKHTHVDINSIALKPAPCEQTPTTATRAHRHSSLLTQTTEGSEYGNPGGHDADDASERGGYDEEEEDEDEDRRERHVDVPVLGSLEENIVEDEPDHLEELQHRIRRTVSRVGVKIDGRFVFQRRAEGVSESALLEECVMDGTCHRY